MIASASMWPWRRARSTSPLSRFVKARRLASPVRGSVCDQPVELGAGLGVGDGDGRQLREGGQAALVGGAERGRPADPAVRAPHRRPRVHSGAAMPLRRPASSTSETESSGAASP